MNWWAEDWRAVRARWNLIIISTKMMNEIPQPTRTAAAVSDGDKRESDIISHKKHE